MATLEQYKIAVLPILLFLSGLNYGQCVESNLDLRVPLVISRNMYMKQSEQWKNPALQSYSLHNVPSLNHSFANVLIAQVEDESLRLKTPFWKKIGIYGLEFLGAGCGSATSGFFAYLSSGMPASGPEGWAFYSTYIASNILLTSTCMWGVGKLTKQKGHWWKASIGAGVGAIIGVFVVPAITGWNGEEGDWQWHVLYFTTPALGSLLGFNL